MSRSKRPAGPSLFDTPGVPVASLSGPRDGVTFSPANDTARLNRQAWAVWLVVRDSAWRSLAEISAACGEPEASVSARLRDLRKSRFGSHLVERRRRVGDAGESRGTFEYRVTPRSFVRGPEPQKGRVSHDGC